MAIGIARWLCLNQHTTGKSIGAYQWNSNPLRRRHRRVFQCSFRCRRPATPKTEAFPSLLLGIALQTGISCICIKGVKTGDTRVLELCYRTQGVIGLTNPTSYQ